MARHLIRDIERRIGWRVAVRRCGHEPSSMRLLSIEERFDSNAATYTIESRTHEAMRFLTKDGPTALGWALGSRTLDLGVNLYHPNLHRFLIEDSPLVVGDLPPREVDQWNGGAVSVLLGCDEATGEHFRLPLFTPERGASSLLIAGTTGGGKSNTLRVVLDGLRGQADLVGLDAKSGETLRHLRDELLVPFVDPVADPDDAVELLSKLIDVMTWRHQQTTLEHRPLFLVIEEWAALPERSDLLDALDRLAAQGRSAHIGIIAVTQRPTASKVIRTTTRANLPMRIAHSTVGDEAASEAILGGGFKEASHLPTTSPGSALIRNGGGPLIAIRIFRHAAPTM